jgi:hypothetical protein
MEKVRVENAVGMVLAHDLTKVVPGEFKGVAFKKGHIIYIFKKVSRSFRCCCFLFSYE